MIKTLITSYSISSLLPGEVVETTEAKKAFFHNPGRNAVPEKGYTEPDSHLSFFYYQKMFFQQLFGYELDPPEARAHHDDHH